MIRKNIQITKEQDEQLKKESYEKDISQSEIIREALQNYFKGENKMTRQKLIEKLKGNTITVTSDWLEENDDLLYEFLKDKLQGFVVDPANEANEENIQQFFDGRYLIDINFYDNGVSYAASYDRQSLNNQDNWGEDEWDDWDDIEQLKLYYNKVKEEIK